MRKENERLARGYVVTKFGISYKSNFVLKEFPEMFAFMLPFSGM